MSKHIFERIADAWAEHVTKASPEEMSLKNFPLPIPEGEEFDSLMAEVDAEMDAERKEREEFRKKYEPIYGDEWFHEFYKQRGEGPKDYNEDMKLVNTWIYMGWMSLFVTGTPEYRSELKDIFHRREHDLYGDMYGKLNGHTGKSKQAGRLLVQDAIRTGKWKELPDELQVEYHRQVGDLK